MLRLNKGKGSNIRPPVKHPKATVSKRLVLSLILSMIAASVYSIGYSHSQEAKQIRELQTKTQQLESKKSEIQKTEEDNSAKQKQIEELNKQLEETKRQLEARRHVQTALAEKDVTLVIPANISGSHEDWMRQAGISESDFGYVDFIMSHESSWCPTRWQGTHGPCPDSYVEGPESNGSVGYGLCQSTPANKMASAGADWRTNPVTQMKWCNAYAQRAHGGGWYNSYQFWLRNRWW